MDKTGRTEVVSRVRQFILDHFDEPELAECVYFGLDGTDLYAKVKSSRFEQLVFELLMWSLRQGEAQFVKLVRAVVARLPHIVPAGQDLLRDVEAMVAGVPSRAAPAAMPAAWRFPDEVAGMIRLLDEALAKTPAGPDRGKLVRNFVNSIGRFKLDEVDLPDPIYLSDSGGERLAAIAALMRQPRVRCLRWLCERVVVEGPQIGQLAAQAMTYAALRVSRPELDRLRACIQDASAMLGTVDSLEREQELRQALEVVDKRRGGTFSAAPAVAYDEVLTALAEAFPMQPDLERLCRRVDVRLDRLVNMPAPVEHVIFAVVRTAEQAGWIRDLIRAARDERQDHAGLAAVYDKVYGPPVS